MTVISPMKTNAAVKQKPVSDKIEDAAKEAADMAQEAAKELTEKATTIVEEDKEA